MLIRLFPTVVRVRAYRLDFTGRNLLPTVEFRPCPWLAIRLGYDVLRDGMGIRISAWPRQDVIQAGDRFHRFSWGIAVPHEVVVDHPWTWWLPIRPIWIRLGAFWDAPDRWHDHSERWTGRSAYLAGFELPFWRRRYFWLRRWV